MNQTLMNLFGPPERERVERITAEIEFDGGTSNNRPSLGYGDGYGSFRIDQGQTQRVAFGPMSSNAAEIFTMAAAIRAARAGGATALVLCGDSKIALGWAERVAGLKRARKHNGVMSEGMKESIVELRRSLEGVEALETKWQERNKSIETFGH